MGCTFPVRGGREPCGSAEKAAGAAHGLEFGVPKSKGTRVLVLSSPLFILAASYLLVIVELVSRDYFENKVLCKRFVPHCILLLYLQTFSNLQQFCFFLSSAVGQH